MDLNYDPRCSSYPKGGYYYISYYLPNGRRICRSTGSQKKSVARKKMHLKEQELYEGIYDDHDIARMPEYQFGAQIRLDLETAVDKYIKASSINKKPRSQINDEYALKSLLKKLEKVYVDEITPYEIQILLGILQKEGKSEATLKTYRGILKKFFNWLIENRFAEMLNPVTRNIQIRKSSGLVRDHLPKNEEIHALLDQDSEIRPLIQFLAFSGARLGEALHMEWGDLKNGIWMIRNKPECMTKEGLGWSPKWGKHRSIPLLREALEVIDSQKRISNWVFPKKDGSRRDSLTRSWATMKRNAGVVNLQIKDFRNWFNDYLKQKYDFTTKEAANYLGHSPEVNETHYEPVSQERIVSKVNGEQTAATNLLSSLNSFSEESNKLLETLALWSGWRG